jgi:hypothetical protein
MHVTAITIEEERMIPVDAKDGTEMICPIRRCILGAASSGRRYRFNVRDQHALIM